MSRLLRVSLAANLGLLALLLLGRRPTTPPAPAALAAPAEPALPPVPNPAPPFHWRQVESPDYRAYIANLRRIGCPESTIRDIISADVANLYARRQAAVARELRGAVRPDRPTWEALERRLREEPALVVNALLGPDPHRLPEPAPAVPDEATPPPFAAIPPGVPVPLFLQPIDPAWVRLDPGQAQAVEDLRQQFFAEIGAAGQDPNDPAYREKWAAAQPQFDQLLRGMIGARAFQQYELGTQAAAEPADPAGP